MIQDYFKHQEGSITICNKDGIIIYMNDKSIATFGNKIGQSLFPCHSEKSIEKIHALLQGGSNAYTIEKNGVKKIIYQTPWKDENGEIGGLIEYSFVIPFDMPHHIR